MIDKVNSKHSNFPSCPCLNVNYVTVIVKRRKQSDSSLRSDVSYFFSLLHEIRNRKRLHAGSSVKTYVAKREDPASRDNRARSTSCHLYEHDLNTLKKLTQALNIKKQLINLGRTLCERGGDFRWIVGIKALKKRILSVIEKTRHWAVLVCYRSSESSAKCSRMEREKMRKTGPRGRGNIEYGLSFDPSLPFLLSVFSCSRLFGRSPLSEHEGSKLSF